MNDKKDIQEQNVPTNEDTPKTYTEEQMREIFNEGQKSGYLSAIKTIRSNINDYLDNLIIAAQMNKGE
jgi:hypothetical protein